ncbi:hypothetical protein IX321_000291 [Bacteroides pyogenes]|nr:hypothetical protein [Bacteroides pyogenes]MBR8716329.1 hypothetical protein [Bacteroides pyogenes]MBR8745735.1 hypothetical protein [Bacteroides pyogenes]MBR8756165.1 hypothetical protein [Bacteroides pyogenes]MBR8779345.1 hypothetical protein [Bacteroides pyogenes]
MWGFSKTLIFALKKNLVTTYDTLLALVRLRLPPDLLDCFDIMVVARNLQQTIDQLRALPANVIRWSHRQYDNSDIET